MLLHGPASYLQAYFAQTSRLDNGIRVDKRINIADEALKSLFVLFSEEMLHVLNSAGLSGDQTYRTAIRSAGRPMSGPIR